MGLLDLLKKIPDANEIKGSFGEQLTKYYSKVTTDTLVLHDVLIDGEDMTSQIDLLLIGHKGIYVVEVKNYENAMIYGDGKKSKWYYYRGGKKYDIYSPLKQNKKHVKYLKEFLKEFGEVPCFSVLTILCRDFKITNINENPDCPDTCVCSGLFAMSDGMMTIAKYYPDIFNDERKQEIYDFIVANQYQGKEIREEHKQKLQEIKKESEQMKERNICPYCKQSLVLRKGKFGEFYGCSNYPKCRYTQKL